MIDRLSASFLLGLILVGNVFADMAPPSPSPTGTGGITFGTHDLSRSITPLGWLYIVALIFVVVFLSVQFARARRKPK